MTRHIVVSLTHVKLLHDWIDVAIGGNGEKRPQPPVDRIGGLDKDAFRHDLKCAARDGRLRGLAATLHT